MIRLAPDEVVAIDFLTANTRVTREHFDRWSAGENIDGTALKCPFVLRDIDGVPHTTVTEFGEFILANAGVLQELADPVDLPAATFKATVPVAQVFASIPMPRVPATRKGRWLPEFSGVYFAWDCNGVLAYVGTSVDISRRARLGKHGNLRDGDWLSWLPFDEEIRLRAECYYIGTYAPPRNFRSTEATA